jgi:outer membrane protein OmpA-like peptidoglycan-associated protein
MVSVPFLLVTVIAARPMAEVLTGLGPTGAVDAAAAALPWMVVAGLAQFTAGLLASTLAALDDYVVHATETVNFRVGSAVLSPDAKSRLDAVAQQATTMKGYTIEITGFASAEGGTAMNKALSKRRAQAVIDYLVENHNVPLRRIGTSYGFGELQAVADNTTREGREQNRRVEVKLLVSRGMNQNVEVRPTTDTTDNGN